MADQPNQLSDFLPFVWYRTTFGKLMIAAPIVCILVVLLLVLDAHYWRDGCDRGAEESLSKLKSVLNRLVSELDDLNMGRSSLTELTDDQLRFMLGSYYGWYGSFNAGGNGNDVTGPKKDVTHCRILIKIANNEIRSCAVRGARAGGNERDRRIYRIALPSLEALEPTVGPWSGKEYGYVTTFTESIVNYRDHEGTWRKPASAVVGYHGTRIMPIDDYERLVASGLVKE